MGTIGWAALYRDAMEAGRKAAQACKPTPMVVQEHTRQFDDASPVKKQWVIPEGVCGFAWVSIRPARGPFVAWLKSQGIGRLDRYAGGYAISIRDYNQSMELKEAHASAMAATLRAAGIEARAQSRID